MKKSVSERVFRAECHVDTTFLRFLLGGALPVIHASSIGGVSNELAKSAEDGTTQVGLVDDDKRVPNYLRTFEVVESTDWVDLKQKPDSPQCLLVIKPAFEKFLLRNCEAVGVSVEAFGFPADFKKLKKRTQRSQIESDADFQSLLVELDERQAPDFVVMRQFLNRFL
jgi:hypothetical protein